ncbi:MAG: FKBP-type peptidyl-prolyl cis-trans isomerase [Porphyromonadaceae bacterium]|nr:FKBP-type peptidyl-prolyl cis-trans isomerase [Porphyromonadaceae bacterium]
MKTPIKAICVTGLALLGAVACSPKVTKQVAPAGPVLANEVDSAAYVLGFVNGDGFRRSISDLPGDSLSRDLILEGFSAGMKENHDRFKLEDAQKFLQDYIKKIQERDLQEMKQRNDSALLANKTKEGVKTTESGLQYRVLRPATGVKPTVQDTVVVDYVGRTIDGKEFDSSYKRGQSATFSLLQVIPGWTEGICLMEKGSKYEFYIPASLAYGERGAGRDIAPHSTLIFEVELHDIKSYVEPAPAEEPKTEAPAPKKAKRGAARKK